MLECHLIWDQVTQVFCIIELAGFRADMVMYLAKTSSLRHQVTHQGKAAHKIAVLPYYVFMPDC